MNNRQLYQKAFSKLKATDRVTMEDIKMRQRGKNMRCRRSVLVLSAVLTLLMAVSAVAYAVTEGRIVENLKVFLGGRECSSVVTENEDGTYRIHVVEDSGNKAGQGI